MPLKLYFMKCSERKVSQCIFALTVLGVLVQTIEITQVTDNTIQENYLLIIFLQIYENLYISSKA